MTSIEDIGARVFDSLEGLEDITSRYSERSPYHPIIGQIVAAIGSEDIVYISGRGNDALNLADYQYELWVFTRQHALTIRSTSKSNASTTVIPLADLRSIQIDHAPIVTYVHTGSDWTGLHLRATFATAEVDLPLEDPTNRAASDELARFLPDLLGFLGSSRNT
jgi:hypothetical protein